MDGVIVVESEDSENSIVEVEVPRKPTPPLIEIEDEEIVLNITQENRKNILAKNFIEKDQGMLVMAKETENAHIMSSPTHWTPDMIKFYNDDWGDEEQFVVEKIQEKMDKSPSLWEISRKDIMNMQNKNRSSNIRCWNCHQRGHHFSVCPDPAYVVKCHMCGVEGHAESSCPDSKCLNCGSCSNSYVYCCFKCRNQENKVCSRCQLVGHNFINCTDHWRLFHSTTGTVSVAHPKQPPHKLNKDLWCCNCGKQGHHHVYCNQIKDCGAFKDTLPFVVSYKKAFMYKDSYTTNDSPQKRNKNNEKGKHINDRILRLNPMHKAIRKDKTVLKNKLKSFKKKRRRRRKDRRAGLQAVGVLLPQKK